MEQQNQNRHYLALTIGPIYRTMSHARSTRQLWAASFIFSTLMRALLQRLGKMEGATILSPDPALVDSEKTFYGAGIWPDRCYLELEGKPGADTINTLIEDALKELAGLVSGGEANLSLFQDYFRVYAIYAAYTDEELKAEEKENEEEQEKERRRKSVIYKLNKLLDDAELAESFVPKGRNNITSILDEKPEEHLYLLGFFKAVENSVLTYYEAEDGSKRPRIPSLLEIASREFRRHPEAYYKEVELPVSKQVRHFRGKKNEQDELQVYILQRLKATFPETFRQRHKYIAIVQADGDGVGKLISQIGNDTSRIQQFSGQLMAFARGAAEKVAKFGAFPIYIGGDDLLFVAPVVNEEKQTVLHLLQQLRTLFKEQSFSGVPQVSLSFGLTVTYYKHPLEEALNAAYSQLMYQAKKLKTQDRAGTENKKDALAFLLETHSGTGFGASFHQGLKSYQEFADICQLSLIQDPGFLSGFIYRLRELDALLKDAVRRNTLGAFFDQHFNELKQGDELPGFLKKVKGFVEAVYTDYESGLPQLSEEESHSPQSELIYSALRFAQFLNAADHE
ncbi:MAG: type III-B CRISPR-associated protein Cas10/Cmr2 [Phaeodactylibacter sp.]|nr:type III-B CRISPR-associated protein Cas10/Cmr2 [Phaeodactylibacter sp.]MCB9298285.1 type III-B CRISPR-associated protein Cas10/Cmr2 [Lewinellaceae bacterium]